MSRTRDRHGRGLRGQFTPPGVPLTRTQSQRFDETLLDVLDHLESHGMPELDGVDFAVEDVPSMPPQTPRNGSVDSALDSDVLDDRGVPLARCERAGQRDEKPVIILYRRPLEARAVDAEDLEDLLHDAVIDRLAHLLGRDPDELDPHS